MFYEKLYFWAIDADKKTVTSGQWLGEGQATLTNSHPKKVKINTILSLPSY